MATHPSILAWEISWTEEPGGLQSMTLQRVGQDQIELSCKQAPLVEQFDERCYISAAKGE